MPERSHSWTLIAIVIAMTSLAVRAPSARAQDAPDLYQSTAIVTGTDMRSRPTGFAQCLRDVLVKVSGEPRLIKDARVAELGRHADAFVVSFSYVDVMAGIPVHDDQGTYDRPHYLTVKFDPAHIDHALADLGETPWRGERPVVVPMLSMRRYGPPFLLGAELPAGADERASLAERAEEFGLTARFPTEAELSAWGAAPGHIPSPPAAARPHGSRRRRHARIQGERARLGRVMAHAPERPRLRLGHQRRELRRSLSRHYSRRPSRRLGP